VVINRGDVHYVITEYGRAYLHGKTIRERALLLIGISHPKFRPWLLKEAKRLNYIYRDQQLPTTKDGVVIVYPELFESEYISRSGLKVNVRPIKFTDERMLQELYYSLSEQDRRLRFFAPLKTFSHKLVQSRVAVDYDSHMAIVALVGNEPDEKIIATAEYVLDRDTNLGEISLPVHEDVRKKGIFTFAM